MLCERTARNRLVVTHSSCLVTKCRCFQQADAQKTKHINIFCKQCAILSVSIGLIHSEYEIVLPWFLLFNIFCAGIIRVSHYDRKAQCSLSCLHWDTTTQQPWLYPLWLTGLKAPTNYPQHYSPDFILCGWLGSKHQLTTHNTTALTLSFVVDWAQSTN